MAFSNPIIFEKVVTLAATAEVLTPIRREARNAIIQAKPGNSGTVNIRTEEAGLDFGNLQPGQTMDVGGEAEDTFDLNSLFIKVSLDGEGVDVFYEA